MFQEKEHSSTIWAANYFSLAPVVSNPGTTTTTLYTYDNDGNLTGVGSSTSYAYDFDNRLVQSIVNGVTTTYGYDAFGSRVSQATASSTTFYPNQFVSITNATSSTSATSTDYLYWGSTLLETVDQPLVNGVATGTPVTRYIHTDNLGSTNITSDANQNRAQWFDYAPYGSVIASTNTGTTTDARQYIGQFSDASGLSYLNARYYNGTQAQFTSEDPVFLGTQQNLGDPQSLNAYAYSDDNPITKKDPDGKTSIPAEGFFFGTPTIGTYGALSTSALGGVGLGAAFVVGSGFALAHSTWADQNSTQEYIEAQSNPYGQYDPGNFRPQFPNPKTPLWAKLLLYGLSAGGAYEAFNDPQNQASGDIQQLNNIKTNNALSQSLFNGSTISQYHSASTPQITNVGGNTPLYQSIASHAGGAPTTLYQLLQQPGANTQFIVNNWTTVGNTISQYNAGVSPKK